MLQWQHPDQSFLSARASRLTATMEFIGCGNSSKAPPPPPKSSGSTSAAGGGRFPIQDKTSAGLEQCFSLKTAITAAPAAPTPSLDKPALPELHHLPRRVVLLRLAFPRPLTHHHRRPAPRRAGGGGGGGGVPAGLLGRAGGLGVGMARVKVRAGACGGREGGRGHGSRSGLAPQDSAEGGRGVRVNGPAPRA